ncbi:MAG TPA: tubulin-like doman-containing protein [Gemmataceae bacterium]|nr:tubulin-like doman-containing protein [Gemmataceae bacterium]
MSLRIDVNCEPIPGYRLIERIGGGGFGEVWKAEAPGGLLKAIKVIHGDLRSVDADGCKHAEQELRALKRLQGIRHPYLLSLERYDVVEGRVLIVSELADCNLWERFREHRAQQRQGIPRGELLRYMHEAAEVLDLMNNQYQLQHLDIKPQNLFLLHNHVKVADFGLVKDLEGLRGQITGGVTPVYAAPETFDSIVTRYCDQYSFAIVYQELLTGVRPFDGTSGQKLLLQHLREPPNLGPLPPADRPIIGRALSKRPEDRFPTCLEFVEALSAAGADTPGPRVSVPTSSSRLETPVGTGRTIPPLPPLAQFADPMPPMETPKTQLSLRRDESASALAFSINDVPLPHRIAPPEMTGDGALVPAVLVGLGQYGLEIVGDFKRALRERFGGLDRVPHIKLLFVDTDSAALHTATDLAGLASDEVIPARLNRAAHYLKPRRSGRSIVEGWFDPQMLYRIPRNPATVGVRALGRLAFLDHYRAFTEKLIGALDGCTHPDALNAADRSTKLGLRTNRPRVYVLTGLAGGTGAGMFLDVAYAARHKLRQMGYLEPEIIGVLVTPPSDRAIKGPALANCYAALRELHHYSQPDTTFTAHYEERDGTINDPAPPFTRTFVVPSAMPPKPGEAARESSARRAASFLLGDLLSPLGRAADDARSKKSDFGQGQGEVTVSVFAQAAYVWPRQVLLARTARWLSSSVLTRWTASDPDVIGRYVQTWLQQRWQAEQLGAEHLVARLQKCGETIVGENPEGQFAAEGQQYVQKGWFARDPDPAKLWQTLARLQNMVGMPDERALQRTVGHLEQSLDQAADAVAREYAPKFARLATTLLEHPDYRLVGAEEVIRQAQALIDGILAQYDPTSTNLGFQAIDAFNLIQQYLNAEKGQRRPEGKAIAEAVRAYPTWRYQSIVLRQVCRVYREIRTQLGDQLRELHFCRQRLEDVTAGIQRDATEATPAAERILLPAEVPSLEAALDGLQKSITAEDLRTFDKKLQVQIEQEFTTLFNVVQSSVQMLSTLQTTIHDQAKNFLAPRLGAVNLDQMLRTRYPDRAAAHQAMRWLFDQAEPPIRRFGPDRRETVVVAGPDTDSFRKLAGQALPAQPAEFVPSADEVLVYREYSRVPLTTLPQLGPLGEDAYNTALDGQGGPHSRMDVTNWQDVEVG